MKQSNFMRLIKHSAFVAFFISVVMTFTPTTSVLAQSASGTSGMSVAEMSTLLESLLAMVEELSKQLADLIAAKSSPVAVQMGIGGAVLNTVAVPASPGFVFATLESGKMVPASVNLLASEQKQLVLNAVGADYVFEIPESGISAIVKAGSKVEISLGGLGVGVHTFLCGMECTGSIVIESEDDY